MKFIKATLTMKMAKHLLTKEEIKMQRSGWQELRDEMQKDCPEGLIIDLKVEEVDEDSGIRCQSTSKYQGEVLHCEGEEGHESCYYCGHLNWNNK